MRDASDVQPSSVAWMLAQWTLAIGLLVAVASVPAYRWPWSATLPLRPVAPGLLVSDPLTPFTTPFMSFVNVRFSNPAVLPAASRVVAFAGDGPLAVIDVDRRSLLTIRWNELTAREGGAVLEWNPREPRQVAPALTVRVAVVYEGLNLHLDADTPNPKPGDAEVTVGYDGRQPVVRVVTFWWPVLLGIYAAGCIGCGLPRVRRAHRQTLTRIGAWFNTHRGLTALLIASFLIRLMLVLRGGQYFDWDELRYAYGAEIFESLSTGYIRDALMAVLNSPDHPGYRLVAFVPAFLQVVTAHAAGHPITETRWPSGEWLPAALLASCSVAVIALVYGLAVLMGGSRREGLTAAVLAATSTSLLIYARHFFPYDAALAVLLTALWIGIHPVRSLRAAFVTGLLCGLGFLIYEGSWTLGVTIAAMSALRGTRRPGPTLLRSASIAVGFALLPGLLVLSGIIAGVPVLENILAFRDAVTNGDFSEGWLLPWKYFWSIEHGLILAVGLGIVCAAWRAIAFRADPSAGRGLYWLLAAAAVYAFLAVGSNGLHRLTVYDRLARQMLPFMWLSAAAGFSTLHRRIQLDAVALAIAAVAFAVNAWPFFQQEYPREFVWDAIEHHGINNLRLATTVGHSVEDTAQAFLPAELQHPTGDRRYVLLNTKDIWIAGGEPSPLAPPPGEVLARARHPRALRALQFHGYTPERRDALRMLDFSMQVIDTGIH